MFQDLLAHPDRYPQFGYPSTQRIRDELAGWDLACWSAVPDGYISPAAAAGRLHLAVAAAVLDQDERCHAEVLLRVAAGGRPRAWNSATPG
jgi:hypothetical protein